MKMLPLITEVGGCLVCRFEVLQITIPIRSCTATVNQKVGTADETSSGGHQELCHIAHFVRCSCTPGWHALNHLQIAFLAGPCNSSLANGVMMIPGEIELMVVPRRPQRVASYITRSTLQRFEY